jgi:uncharacterized protein with HEPN domain
MSKDDSVYLKHMLDMARTAMDLAQDRGRKSFEEDPALRYGLAHLIQLIGEAARRVSSDVQKSNSGIPWKEVIGMRHKIVHDYMDVDEEVVWAVATQDLPLLVRQLEILVSG